MEQSPSETVAAPSPPKKKRGRPKKADKLLLLQNSASSATKDALKVRRKRKKGLLKSVPVASHGRKRRQQEMTSPSTTTAKIDSDSEADANTVPEKEVSTGRADVNVGRQVHGVVDGMFDAGYLVTVRVGDTETVFRGVVFGPALSLPLNTENDVAPKLKRMTQQLDNMDDSPGRDVHVVTPSFAADSASMSISSSMPPANEAHAAATMAAPTTGMGAPLSTSNPPPPSGGAAGYSPAVTYRSPLFAPSPLQNASGGFYYAPPPHIPSPNGNQGPAYYPPRGFPAYTSYQYPEYHAASSQFAGPPPAAAASVSPSPNMQGTLPPRTS